MKTFILLMILFFVSSCATPMNGDNFFGHHAGVQAGNAAMDAGNAATMHQMHHMPAPMTGF